MELSASKKISGLGQSVRPAAAPKTGETAGQTLRAAYRQTREDRLELSRQVVEYLDAQNEKLQQQWREHEQKVKERRQALDRLNEPTGMESILESFDKNMDIMKKCAQIAAAVQNGDKVPEQDLRYLIKHDIRAYMMAMANRRPKEDPEEKDSVLTEEDLRAEADGSAGQTGGTEGAASPALSGESSGEGGGPAGGESR